MKRLMLVVLFASLITSPAAVPTASASSMAGYPGGKYLWEYAVTSVTTQTTPGHRDTWARVGWYDLTDLNNVTEYYWFWSQDNLVGHAVARTDACPSCSVYAPNSYNSGPAARHGLWTFDATTGYFSIDYDDGALEVWKINTAITQSDLRRMDLTAASYSFGHGWTYGSNPSRAYGPSASWMLANAPGPYVYGYGCISDNPNNVPAPLDKCSSSGQSLSLTGFYSCPGTAECISDVVACGSCSLPYDKHFLATFSGVAPRKVVHEFYAIPTSADYCPSATQSEHVQALREIIGDTGTVYGFIGVEASLYSSVRNGLDRIAAMHWTNIAADPRS